ncbi:MAG: hypothetical protein E6Q97_16050 [Desulfurellales bacterium]|nr:MAG: hypothetical protein E6Q97_16050 [Desulfurellales bacterium]
MSDYLPGYAFDRRSARYRDVATGRYASRSRIVDLLEESVQQSESRMQRLTVALYEQQLAPAVWLAAMRDELRRAHLQYAALGKGGFDRLTLADLGRIGATLRQEYVKLVGTVGDVQTASLPQLLNRVRRHAGQARTEYFRTLRDVLAENEGGPVHIARRILEPGAEHCKDCLRYYDEGWSVVELLIPPGEQCECGGNCRCKAIYHAVAAEELGEWLGTKRQVIRQARGVTYDHVLGYAG